MRLPDLIVVVIVLAFTVCPSPPLPPNLTPECQSWRALIIVYEPQSGICENSLQLVQCNAFSAKFVNTLDTVSKQQYHPSVI